MWASLKTEACIKDKTNLVTGLSNRQLVNRLANYYSNACLIDHVRHIQHLYIRALLRDHSKNGDNILFFVQLNLKMIAILVKGMVTIWDVATNDLLIKFKEFTTFGTHENLQVMMEVPNIYKD
ncbi:hypothetical protein ACJX0J_036974, partial [Zea mays]